MNDTTQNERTGIDILGLLLFGVGAFASTLLVQALREGSASGETSNQIEAMGHALLWAGGAVPVFMLSL